MNRDEIYALIKEKLESQAKDPIATVDSIGRLLGDYYAAEPISAETAEREAEEVARDHNFMVRVLQDIEWGTWSRAWHEKMMARELRWSTTYNSLLNAHRVLSAEYNALLLKHSMPWYKRVWIALRNR